jgi:hypothetical protein
MDHIIFRLAMTLLLAGLIALSIISIMQNDFFAAAMYVFSCMIFLGLLLKR